MTRRWRSNFHLQSMPGMAGAHDHGSASGGIMSGGTGIKNLDTRAVLKGDVTLAM